MFAAIDLKSFYASVECVERGLDPLDACLVVADSSRTDKTICLAVSPTLKSYGVSGRPRLFEVRQRLREVNRGRNAGKSASGAELAANPALAVDFITAMPRMSLYLTYSARIYGIYLRFVAPEDIHVYSVDEVFIDLKPYLTTYGMTAHELTISMIRAVLAETGITATAGIGTNLYLAKVAMDIVAKKMPPDSDGVRIAELDEQSYRRKLWAHRPLTDFWRVGSGIAARLAEYGIETMGDIARCSTVREDFLYHRLGVNAELLIDHAWGVEPVRIADIKAYRPETHSLGNGQVLQSAYPAENARTVALEMADTVALDLIDKELTAGSITLTVSYDAQSLERPDCSYTGRTRFDHYGRRAPVHAHGSTHFSAPTSSAEAITTAVAEIFDRVVNKSLLIRRLCVTACDVISQAEAEALRTVPRQLDLFSDYDELQRRNREERSRRERERRRLKAVLSIKRKFGKNAILRGLNYGEGATQRERNNQIGGHKA